MRCVLWRLLFPSLQFSCSLSATIQQICELCRFPQSPFPSLPETAPTNVVLAQILQLSRLDNELVYLRKDVQLLAWLEIPSSQLLRYPIQDLECTSILYLGRILVLLAVDAVGSVHVQAGRHTR